MRPTVCLRRNALSNASARVRREILPQSQYLSNDSEVEDSHPLVGRLISGDAAAGAGAADAAGSAGAQLYSDAVTELGWPNRVERLTVPAGTVVITHFDVFHRGTHGPHDGQPHRLMLKLWYTRGQDNTDGPSWDHTPAEDDQAPAIFRETRVSAATVGSLSCCATLTVGRCCEQPPAADVEGQAVIWDTMWRWMLGVPPPVNSHRSSRFFAHVSPLTRMLVGRRWSRTRRRSRCYGSARRRPGTTAA